MIGFLSPEGAAAEAPPPSSLPREAKGHTLLAPALPRTRIVGIPGSARREDSGYEELQSNAVVVLDFAASPR